MFPEETHRRAGAGEGARHRSASGKMQTEAPGRRRPRPAERLFPKQAGTPRARCGSGLAAAGPAWSERCMRRPRTGRLVEPPQKAAGLSPVTRQNQGRAVRRDSSQGGSRGARLRAAVT